MIINRPGQHSCNRLFEWCMAVALLGLGIHLIIWPNAIAASKFQFMLDILSNTMLMMFYLWVGLIRCTALYVNSDWPKSTAYIRFFGAICGAAVWLQMAISLIIVQYSLQMPPSPSVWLYSMLAISEFISSARALADARVR